MTRAVRSSVKEGWKAYLGVITFKTSKDCISLLAAEKDAMNLLDAAYSEEHYLVDVSESGMIRIDKESIPACMEWPHLPRRLHKAIQLLEEGLPASFRRSIITPGVGAPISQMKNSIGEPLVALVQEVREGLRKQQLTMTFAGREIAGETATKIVAAAVAAVEPEPSSVFVEYAQALLKSGSNLWQDAQDRARELRRTISEFRRSSSTRSTRSSIRNSLRRATVDGLEGTELIDFGSHDWTSSLARDSVAGSIPDVSIISAGGDCVRQQAAAQPTPRTWGAIDFRETF
ncbi:hypothetical protein GNI_136730 [Gregarina niphandrodes]|uniref:Uncharacterized protein n=1 Tax=Gregarina niphandrodes TaxID=110365 RepID=A0A023B0S3_GRENI|nr:hypothetical protein GNI_136730 [Gregarina niphandrodes]EZG45804.1 hypothetical protein GNI_136730 [Gregarina niphandrodes]|eukprot:XP_011132441.1 hypothetical protein GNI_136730 [Gregarina niphandrodes]